VNRPETAKDLLAAAGVRATPIRRTVLSCLLRLGSPASHAELAARDDLGVLDRVSLYRTLRVLREARLVHAVQGVDGVWRYCAHAPRVGDCPGNHPHFLCQSCGRMWCLTGQRLPQVAVPADLEVRGKQLVVYGLCSPCRQLR
jgi:Fur family ferric uptake transcriptional regulator